MESVTCWSVRMYQVRADSIGFSIRCFLGIFTRDCWVQFCYVIFFLAASMEVFFVLEIEQFVVF